MNFDAVKKILIDEAVKCGLEDYEIYFTQSSSISAETLKDELSSFASGSGAGISFRCVVGGHNGVAATELFTEDELKSLVKRAMDNATVIENDDLAIIYGGSEEYAVCEKPEFQMPGAAEIRKLALDIQARTYAGSEFVTDGTQSSVFAGTDRYELVNSKGLELSNTVSLGGAYAVAVINKDGEPAEEFEFALGYKNTEELSKKALEGALSKIGSTTVDSGKYKVILSGSQMRSMLATFSSIFSGKQALLGMSLLAGKEGQQIASDKVTIVDDALYAGSMVQTAFDGEGVATYTKNVVENGVLKTLLYDLASAHKAGVKSTANGQRASYAQQVNIAPFTFYIKGGELSEDELLAKMGDGLYVTELKGMHAGASAVTGDFSLESAGYIVKDGKKQAYAKGFTVAGNFFEMLKSIEDMASEVHFGIPGGFTVFGSPDVLISEMSVAGK